MFNSLLHPLKNIEITNCFNYEPNLMVFFQKGLSICDKSRWQKNKGTHCVSLLIDRNATIYFDSFRIEYIPQEVLSKIKDKSR